MSCPPSDVLLPDTDLPIVVAASTDSVSANPLASISVHDSPYPALNLTNLFPPGSMDSVCLTSPDTLPSPTGKGPSRPCNVTPLFGSAPHACMMDVTHDNQSPLDKRTAEDALSTGALATFCFSAIGSNKGFDDLYPKLLDLVTDTRMYDVGGEGVDRGIGKLKRVLNHLHTEMVLGGFTEGHVHQENDVGLFSDNSACENRADEDVLLLSQYIVLHRIHPQTHKGYLLVSHTAFSKDDLKSRGASEWPACFSLSAIVDVDERSSFLSPSSH